MVKLEGWAAKAASTRGLPSVVMEVLWVSVMAYKPPQQKPTAKTGRLETEEEEERSEVKKDWMPGVVTEGRVR